MKILKNIKTELGKEQSNKKLSGGPCCLSFFFCHHDEILWQKHPRKKELMLAHSSSLQSVKMVKSSRLDLEATGHMCLQPEESRNIYASDRLFLYFRRCPSQGISLSKIKYLHTSTNIIEINPHMPTHKAFSQGILDFVKLKININHHTYQRNR